MNFKEIKKALIIGDLHANSIWLKKFDEYCQNNDIDAIIQVGDLGYYPDAFPKEWRRMSTDTPLLFCDGNHEDHDKLKVLTDITEIKKNFFYFPRGTRIEIQKLGVLFVGGAYSIDWKERAACYRDYPSINNKTWFPEEQLTDEQVNACKRHDSRSVNMLIAHDCPWSISIVSDGRFPASIPNRERLDEIYKYYRPNYLYFGHYHRHFVTYDYTNYCVARCLPGEFRPISSIVFDFEKEVEANEYIQL